MRENKSPATHAIALHFFFRVIIVEKNTQKGSGSRIHHSERDDYINTSTSPSAVRLYQNLTLAAFLNDPNRETFTGLFFT